LAAGNLRGIPGQDVDIVLTAVIIGVWDKETPNRRPEMTGPYADLTYEEICALARRKSARGWAAVVTITRYMGGTPTRTIAVSSTGPIRSHQNRGEFRGVDAQFHNGQPISA
jgi:hypothetical protein